MKMIFLFFVFCFGVLADGSAYSKNVSIFARSGNLIFLHEHKFNFETDEDGKVNSYVELIDVSIGRTIFKKNSQFYSNVFALEKGRFFLALSNLKVGSNPQLVVYSSSGDVIGSETFRCADIAAKDSCVESNHNYIYWFDERWQHVKSDVSGDILTIIVDGNEFRYPLGIK